jgi:glycosyltransferase involved in cell wall biosynthesis
MKKIVVLENSYLSTVTMRRALMNALTQQGFDVYILSSGKEEFAERLKEIDATFIDIGSSTVNPVEVLKYIKRLRGAIKQIKPDICLTFTPRQNIYGNFVCKTLGIPVLSNITGTGVPFHIEGFVYWVGRRFYKQVLKNPKVVFFQNNDDLTDLVAGKYVKKEQAVLIPGSGVETGRFLPVKKGAHDKFVFLFIGRLVKIKGIEELITAAENILKDKNNCEFWIVGPLWKQNTGKLTFTEADVEEWKRKGIIYKGEAKDVRPFLGACDCFVLPSYREGLSNSLLEAASMERPIVTTNVTGCRDVVVDGLNGFLCESENAVSLEQCLRKMLAVSEHERNEMGRQGRIKVKKEYEKSLVIEKYIEQINKFA